MPPFDDFKPFIVTGLALGGVYAVSGVGMVVLYRATGVLNLAFGTIGALGALIAWTLLQHGVPDWLCYLAAVGIGGVLTLAYGMAFGPPLAARDPLVKAVATLGLALVLLGAMDWIWPSNASAARSLILPTTNWSYDVTFLDDFVNGTQIMAFLFGVVLTIAIGFLLRRTRLGTAMRALANDREITATLGVPVRRVEAVAWFGSGLIAGAAGLLLANLVALDPTTLTFLVISSLAATLIGRLRSLEVTFVAGVVVGLVDALITPILSLSSYRDMTPFVLAAVALLWVARRRGVALAQVLG
jgi:branched-chain amino acid transport system permease protein